MRRQALPKGENMRGYLAILATIVGALVLPGFAHAAPPPNDAFAAAETISGPSGTVYGTTVEATTEAGEPPSMPLNHSIWYAWTAPGYGTFSFNTGGTTYAWVFTGDALGALDLKINGQGYGFVSVRPGVTYRIALDDWLSGGPTQLTWSYEELPAPPPNDDWANAQPLAGTSGTVELNTLGATRESCDSAFGFQRPVWYAWTAPADGELTVDAATETRGTIVAVFTGSSLCSLVERTRSGGDPAYADVTAGGTYWIGVDTWTDSGGPTSFSWSFATVMRPANDDFANAEPLGPEYRGSVSGSTLHATSEPGEPTPFFGRTVWYSWTPAESGVASINVQLANGVVYAGPAIGSLTTVAFGNSTFAVTGGVTYHIQVAGGESFTLEWLLEPDRPPANDAFANAQPLSDASGRIEATNRLATVEPGEPDHGGESKASVWFTWTADADGVATFHVDSSFWTIHAVYVGNSVDALTSVEQTRDVDAQVVRFTAQAGITYRIAVDGRAGGTGVFWLDWSFEPAGGGGGGGGTTGSPPNAAPDAFVTEEDTPLTLTADDLLGNDSDPDGDAISLAAVTTSKKGHGTVRLVKNGIVFTPAADFNGTASFTYRVVDATGLEATALVNVEVIPVNDAPTLRLGADASTVDEGASLALTAQGQDVDGDQLFYDWSTTGGELTADGATGRLVVDDGPASVVVQVFVTDGFDSASATYSVEVTNVAPTVTAQPATGVWSLPVTLSGSATDPSATDTAAGLSPSWSLGGGAVVDALTASRIFDAPGAYPATLAVTDKDGATGSQDVSVDVQKRPSTLVYVGSSSAPFGFGSVGARFADAADAATARVDGHALTFTAGDATLSGSTAGGVATVPVGASLLPGTYSVEARFAGDDLYLPSTAAGSVTVTNSVGKATGDVVLGNGGRASFSIAGDGTGLKGSLAAGAFTAERATALGISDRAAWFAGIGDDGRSFVAYIEDNGEPSGSDVFRLWIAGELYAGSGTVVGGNVQLHR
jgi:Cadherin-like domain/PKD domain